MSESFLAIRNQQVVKIRIGADDPGVPNLHGKHNVVLRCTELDVVPENFSQLGSRRSVVPQPNTLGDNTKSRQLTARAYEGGDPELDLVSIRMAAHADVIERKPKVLAVDARLRHTLIDDGAVTHRALQGFDQ